MLVLNPFKKHDVSEFEGVLIPLEQAEHRNSIVSQQPMVQNGSSPQQDGDEKDSHKDKSTQPPRSSSEASVTHGTAKPGATIGLTLQDLRAEVEQDVAANDNHTAYDSKSRDVYQELKQHYV